MGFLLGLASNVFEFGHGRGLLHHVPGHLRRFCGSLLASRARLRSFLGWPPAAYYFVDPEYVLYFPVNLEAHQLAGRPFARVDRLALLAE